MDSSSPRSPEQDRLYARLLRLQADPENYSLRSQGIAEPETLKQHTGYFHADISNLLVTLDLGFVEQSDVTSMDCSGLHPDLTAEIAEK